MNREREKSEFRAQHEVTRLRAIDCTSAFIVPNHCT
jgi:hypothetical protein